MYSSQLYFSLFCFLSSCANAPAFRLVITHLPSLSHPLIEQLYHQKTLNPVKIEKKKYREKKIVRYNNRFLLCFPSKLLLLFVFAYAI